jgi:hypothetical protein
VYVNRPSATLHVVKRIAEGPMDTGPLRAVVRHLRRWAGPAGLVPSSDADLLTRFVEARDEVAFAEKNQFGAPPPKFVNQYARSDTRKLLVQLLKDRLAAAPREFEVLRTAQAGAGARMDDRMTEAAGRVLMSELDLSTSAEERLKAYAKYLKVTEDAEKASQALYDAGRIPIQDLERSRFLRMDATIKLIVANRSTQEKPDAPKDGK